MKICSKCNKDRNKQRLVHKNLCDTCYRINERIECMLKVDNICTACDSCTSSKWYSGPICRKCYRAKRSEDIKTNDKKQYINKRIKNNLRSRISKIVSGIIKEGSAVSDLGCSIEEFKVHLSNKFYHNTDTGENMSWDNYGQKTWHIDHIRPLSSFDLTDSIQLKEACHYTNLQPLWAKDNLLKSDKYENL